MHPTGFRSAQLASEPQCDAKGDHLDSIALGGAASFLRTAVDSERARSLLAVDVCIPSVLTELIIA